MVLTKVNQQTLDFLKQHAYDQVKAGNLTRLLNKVYGDKDADPATLQSLAGLAVDYIKSIGKPLSYITSKLKGDTRLAFKANLSDTASNLIKTVKPVIKQTAVKSVNKLLQDKPTVESVGKTVGKTVGKAVGKAIGKAAIKKFISIKDIDYNKAYLFNDTWSPSLLRIFESFLDPFGTLKYSDAQKKKKIKEYAIQRAKLLTQYAAMGFKIPPRLLTMGAGGVENLLKPPSVQPGITIPIFVDTSAIKSPQIKNWTPAQIYTYVTSPDGYMKYLAQGGVPLDELDKAFELYVNTDTKTKPVETDEQPVDTPDKVELPTTNLKRPPEILDDYTWKRLIDQLKPKQIPDSVKQQFIDDFINIRRRVMEVHKDKTQASGAALSLIEYLVKKGGEPKTTIIDPDEERSIKMFLPPDQYDKIKTNKEYLRYILRHRGLSNEEIAKLMTNLTQDGYSISDLQTSDGTKLGSGEEAKPDVKPDVDQPAKPEIDQDKDEDDKPKPVPPEKPEKPGDPDKEKEKEKERIDKTHPSKVNVGQLRPKLSMLNEDEMIDVLTGTAEEKKETEHTWKIMDLKPPENDLHNEGVEDNKVFGTIVDKMNMKYNNNFPMPVVPDEPVVLEEYRAPLNDVKGRAVQLIDAYDNRIFKGFDNEDGGVNYENDRLFKRRNLQEIEEPNIMMGDYRRSQAFRENPLKARHIMLRRYLK